MSMSLPQLLIIAVPIIIIVAFLMYNNKNKDK